MLRKIYSFIRNILENTKMHFVRKDIAKHCTLIGTKHGFSVKSRIKLLSGSTREDVVLHDHCEVFGTIKSYNHGKVVMKEWSKLGPNSFISCTNHIEIGRDTANSFGVTVTDNNAHPTDPLRPQVYAPYTSPLGGALAQICSQCPRHHWRECAARFRLPHLQGCDHRRQCHRCSQRRGDKGCSGQCDCRGEPCKDCQGTHR